MSIYATTTIHQTAEEETGVSAARMKRSLRTVRALKALGSRNSDCVRECRCDELPCPLLTWLLTELWNTCPELPGRRVGDVVLMAELRDSLEKLFCPTSLLSADVPGPVLFNQVCEFLVSELQAAQILRYKELQPEDQSVKEEEAERDQRVEDPYEDSDEGDDDEVASSFERKEVTHAEVTLLIQDLHLDAASQFTDIIHEVESKLSLLPGGDMAEPLLKSTLSSTQWRQIEKLNHALLEDYRCRRQMMIKRFEVTLQSFAWGEKEKEKERSDALASVPPIASLPLGSQVSLPLLLAAREDQSCIMPVKAGPSTAVHKVQMGSVPDRGGRPGEIERPMPVWEGRKKGNRSARGGGRNQQQQRKKERTRKGRRESKSPE